MIKDLKYRLLVSNVTSVVFISISAYLFILIIRLYFQLNGTKIPEFENGLVPNFALHNNGSGTLTHAWVVLTHFITEMDIMSLISNVIWLYFFGFMLEEFRGNGATVTLFFMTGLLSGLLLWLLSAIAPSLFASNYYWGMKAPIAAIAAAAVLINPKRGILHGLVPQGIPIYIIGVLYLLLTIVGVVSFGAAGLIAVLFGIGCGWWYIKAVEIPLYKLQKWVNNKLSFNKNKMTITKNENFNSKGYNYIQPSEQKLNELLDKINDHGMSSLSPEEKEWLKKASKQ